MEGRAAKEELVVAKADTRGTATPVVETAAERMVGEEATRGLLQVRVAEGLVAVAEEAETAGPGREVAPEAQEVRRNSVTG